MISITPGSGVTEKVWKVAFEDNLAALPCCGRFDGGGEVEPVFGAGERRDEDVELAVADLDGECGPDEIGFASTDHEGLGFGAEGFRAGTGFDGAVGQRRLAAEGVA